MVWKPITRHYVEFLAVGDAAWSPTGEELAISGVSGGLLLCTDRLECIRQMDGYMKYSRIDWSPDGKSLVHCGHSLLHPPTNHGEAPNAIRIWDVETGAVRHTLYETTDYYSRSVAYSPDGRVIASPTSPGYPYTDPDKIHIWDAASGTKLNELVSPIELVDWLIWNATGDKFMILADNEGSIYDVHTGQFEMRLDSGCVKWSPDGKSILKMNAHRQLDIIDVRSGETVVRFNTQERQFRNGRGSFGWKYDSSQVAAIDEQGAVHIWNVADGLLHSVISADQPAVRLLTWRPNHAQMVCITEKGDAVVWDANENAPLYTLPSCPPQVGCCSWDNGGMRLVAVGQEGCSQTWIFDDDRLHQPMPSVDIPLEVTDYLQDWLRWHPDSDKIAIVIDGKPLQIWDVNFRDNKQLQPKHRGYYSRDSVVWSHNGTYIAETIDDVIYIWDVQRLEVAFTFQFDDPKKRQSRDIYWSKDDTEIIMPYFDNSQFYDGLAIWSVYANLLQSFALNEWLEQVADRAENDDIDVKGYLEIATFLRSLHHYILDQLQVQYDINSLSGAMANELFAFSYETGLVKVINIKDGKEICRFHDHFRDVDTLSWHPDGVLLLTGSDDHTVRIYDTDTQQLLQTLHHDSQLVDAAWSPDGTKIATLTLNNLLQIWARQ